MTLIVFAVAEIVGLLSLLGAWKGVFGLPVAFLAMLVMLALSFHVLARDPRPDGTSVRMASFAAMCAYGSILCGKLALEWRGVLITTLAVLLGMLLASVAAATVLAVTERPLRYDVEEAE